MKGAYVVRFNYISKSWLFAMLLMLETRTSGLESPMAIYIYESDVITEDSDIEEKAIVYQDWQ